MPAFSRLALYDLVWETPIRTLAESFGVSDVWLKKCCAKADIPVPQRGYWAKHRVGKLVPRTKLPARAPGNPDTIRIGQERYNYWRPIDIEAELATPPPEPPQFPEPIADVRERTAKRLGIVPYRRDLSSPHPLVAKLLADDNARKSTRSDAPYRLRSNDPLFASPFERRRLKILNALFVALAKAGAPPWLDDDEARAVGFVVGVERVAIKLDHPDANPDREGRYRTRAGFADILRLAIIGSDLAWSDTLETALEAHLADIAVEIVVAGEAQLRASAQTHFEWACKHREELARQLAEHRAEVVRRARERAIKAEREHQEKLLRMAADYRRAGEMRSLVDEVVRIRGADPAQSDRVAKWAKWARAIANRIDPVPRLVFDDEGRASLTEASPPEPDQ